MEYQYGSILVEPISSRQHEWFLSNTLVAHAGGAIRKDGTFATKSSADKIINFASKKNNIKVITCKYGDESFDYVIANHVLLCCDDLNSVLWEMKRVLKPQGVLICSTYGSKHMKEITDLVQGFQEQITLSADRLYEKFGLDNGMLLLESFF